VLASLGAMLLVLSSLALGLQLPVTLNRRSVLHGAVAAGVLPALSPNSAQALISATTMTGKSKPDLGIVLVDEPQLKGKSVEANLVLADGLVASVKFDSNWPLAEGGYFDVETKSRDGGDAAFVQVAKLPTGASLATVPKRFFTDTILSVDGRYGSYGSPTDIKVLSDTDEGATRRIEISFTALSPGSAEVPRRGLVTATQPAGSRELVMLTASTGTARWKKGGKDDAIKAIDSFAVTTRPTTLQQVASTDYRFGKTSGPSNMRSRSDGF